MPIANGMSSPGPNHSGPSHGPDQNPGHDPDKVFDLLVIGAGATGATIALEAVRRGLSVVLVEGSDIASGTSSRSTKLLHGGVRYLELAVKTFDLRQLQLVREALGERGHWLQAVPFLAQPLELLLPTRNLLATAYYGAGLAVYDLLAGRRRISASRCLSRQEVSRQLPELAAGHGGVAYADARFDDARLNLLIARSAALAGAAVHTRSAVVELLRDGQGQLNGAVIAAEPDGTRQRLRARVVVNATGIGADALRRMAQADLPPRLQVSRGMHVVLDDDLCPGGLGLLVPATDDGRVLFMLPFFGRTLVGTTDTACPLAEAERPAANEEAYLLDYVQRWFPSDSPRRVSSRWAGGRPLLLPETAAEAAAGTARVVREHAVERLSCGLISVMGGKWTTCRSMAIDALAVVAEQLGRPLGAPVAGAILGAASDPSHSAAALAALATKLSNELGEPLAAHLIASHGLEAPAVLACAADASERTPLSDVIPLTAAEVRHMARHEWARQPEDVLARRCRLAFVDQAEADRLEGTVGELLEQEAAAAYSPTSHQKKP